jgi:predicted TIM-barrel enzyme
VLETSELTGLNPDKEHLLKGKSTTKVPVVTGFGMTAGNIEDYISYGFIAGSNFRNDKKCPENLEPERLNMFIKAYAARRNPVGEKSESIS